MDKKKSATTTITPSVGFYRYSWAVLVVAILLIWWGAATTTKQAGMAFADWPLSFGSINPDGWLRHMIPFLEHSHRLLATVVGLMVLALFTWAYLAGGVKWKRALEVVLLVFVLGVIFGTFIRAGAEREDAERKASLMKMALMMGVLPWGWWIWSCIARNWRLIEKMTALALLLVTVQAIFGGLRVTEISNSLAVVHGCLAQLFFCLLIFILLLSSRKWVDLPFIGAKQERLGLRAGGTMIFGMIVMQLIFGASMRHHHRNGLADHGIFKTADAWVPPLDDPILAYMFLHKLTAVLILVAVSGLFFWLKLRRPDRREALSHLLFVLIMLLAQLGLGIVVIVSGKNFWITNFHVLNGLAILAMAFVFMIRAWRGKLARDLLAS